MQTDENRNPFELIAAILNRETQGASNHPLPVTLATADSSARPSCRTVLCKQFDENGFVFFTNSQSRKGKQLRENPYASLTFYFPAAREQIHAEGPVLMLSADESDAYWKTRPRQSQIGAWASAQSRPIPAGDSLEERYSEFEKRFQNDPSVPRPGNWNGYRLVPQRLEIWREGDHRLHQRFCYEWHDNSWVVNQLFP